MKGDLNANFVKTGLSYQLISDNLTMFMRALQETGKVEILSRPYITTKDNSKAIFSLGKDVPMLSKLRVSLEGLTGGEVKYQNVATKLTVTPQIHPDNYVTLNIIQDINEIILHVYSKNPRAIRAYEKVGFEKHLIEMRINHTDTET